MRIPPQVLLRGLAKFAAVVVAAGLAGALIGIGLAKLSGNDDGGTPVLPATTEQASTTATKTSAARPSTGTQTTTSSTSTGTTATSTSTTPAKAIYRVPRVQVLSAQLGPVAQTTGRALVAVRVRVTNRGIKALTIETPVLVSSEDEVPLGAAARGAAQPLLRPIAVGSTATGVLRFTVTSTIAQRLAATPNARLRVARRTVALKLTNNATAEPSG